MQEMFLGGSETSSTSIEWALAELIRNPETMMKAKKEISSVVGSNKKFEESDIDKLSYLQAVIKETLRLHPPLPFLIPRRATQDTNFMGYLIPKNTQVFVNVWAIGRDEQYWEEPLVFKPERFLGSKIDYKGQHFEFLPFGAGRRICPGLPLGQRVMHFMLGSLLHEFDWELEFSANPNTIDMTEVIGSVMRKREPLKVAFLSYKSDERTVRILNVTISFVDILGAKTLKRKGLNSWIKTKAKTYYWPFVLLIVSEKDLYGSEQFLD
ncbi:Cytochrome [Forsythia ovata]|uniref:Cytochrome n=1 Tax=Forsythia ovata TaxID=205694 RepID=A0ABD1T7E9_9LAMI